MFTLSTSWNAWRHSRAREIVEEITSLGFNSIELGFNLDSLIVQEMFTLKDQGLINVASVHNFCPLPKMVARPEASPDIFSLSSLNEEERQKAVRYSKTTIDTAKRAGAEAVVLHLGRIAVEERIKKLAALDKNSEAQIFERLKKVMQKEREQKAKIFFNQALKSLKQLCAYAQKSNIKLGIENRYYFSEIPSVEEMEIILATFPSPPLYYWHDVGHAQIYENLGFIKHKIILDKFHQRMLGMHLHDIEGINDHRAPLKGKFNFTQLLPYIKGKILKVLEPHHPATKEDIIQGRKYLEELFAVKGE